jgi:hypothetical protein
LFNFVKLILNTSEHEMRIFKYEKWNKRIYFLQKLLQKFKKFERKR